ncbi:hypothetical protein DFH09DRAFT_1301004 [Mycena vulgaris]|nr:hypothetical protein DFH09DRAFT_1301004 [Mycena vulgaris]
MAGTPVPHAVDCFDTLLEYIDVCDPPALCHSVFGRAFLPPIDGALGRDASAYTRQPGVPFITVVFGRVLSPMVWKDGHRTFRINCSGTAPHAVKEAFAAQMFQIASAVKSDDLNDRDDDKGAHVYMCSDSHRFSAMGGTYLEIHVDHYSTSRCTLYELVEGQLESRVPQLTSDWPLKIGDWVVFRATIHRDESKCDPLIREYLILASELRVVEISDALTQPTTGPPVTGAPIPTVGPSTALGDRKYEPDDGVQLEPKTELMDEGIEVGSPAKAPSSPILDVKSEPSAKLKRSEDGFEYEGSHVQDDPLTSESGRTAVSTRSRTRAASPPPYEGIETSNICANEGVLTRAQKRRIATVEDAGEANPVTSTPKKRTMRMSTGGKPPRRLS